MVIADLVGSRRPLVRYAAGFALVTVFLPIVLACGAGSTATPATSGGSVSPSARGTLGIEAIQGEPGHRPLQGGRPTVPEAEGSLAREATLDVILQVTLARNPELAEATSKARASIEGAPSGGRLPDPTLEYQLWGAPLRRPYALDEAQMHMIGVRQSFPASGSLAAREAAAVAEATGAAEAGRAREQDLVQRVRRAYADYYRVDRESGIYREHLKLAEQATDVASAAYQGGRGAQQDVLRASVAVSELRRDLAALEGERRAARGLLNTLMARAPNAPLGPPATLQAAEAQLRMDDLVPVTSMRRPEIAAAESAVRARASELEGARVMGSWPDFMVGLQYMYMPPMDEPHNYGVTLSMSLPWFNPRYGEEVRAAEARVSAEQSALSSTRYAARYELFEATERLRATRESFTIVERDLLPRARHSFESAEATYRGGSADSLALFDALRSLLDVRVERERALVRMEMALADLERAAGGPTSLSRAVKEK